eukprot:scaffold42858_cov61-Cyclotella_meneghiniana.AAC.3
MATWVIRVKAVSLLTFPTVDYVIPRNCAPMNVLMPESVIISLESVYAVIIEQAMIALSLNALPFMSFAPPATTTNASSVNKDGVFDPRCLNCNATTCNSCVDLLLFSIHRSGRRPQDPPLPIDELTRELSITVPFGSTQEDAFYDAEHYFLVDPDHVPLKESAVECHQGLNSDDSIDCIPYNMTSHVMCGNHGTITFTSPEFAVKEDAKQIRLTLQRSGGGVGEVSVSYSIYPITANYQDVTATAHYTSNQTVVFRHGQIRASFLVTINDDRIMEENVTFSVHLHNPSPSGKVRLGTQQRTIVTIIDDDLQQTCSNQTTVSQNQTDLGETYAGIPLQFTVNAASCSGKAQTAGGDIYKAVARKVASAKEMTYGIAPWFIGTFDDNGNGTYRGAVNVTSTGQYELAIFLLIPGGLRGSYYTDAFLSEPSLDLIRTDATVNFTYGTGPITTFAKDYVSVRWEGCVLPFHTEVYTFWLDIDDQARLWIDNELVIDSWAFSSSLSSSMPHVERKLQASVPHDIVLEYRDITGSAKARLLWSSPNTTLSAIPPSNLLYKERVGRYNFTVHASSVDAKESSATGEGIHSGVAGKELSFTIQPNDRFGNFRGWPLYSLPRDTRHMDHFHASATLLDSNFGEVFVPVNVHYNETTRKFLAFYTPITSGIYQLNVTSSESGSIDAEEHILGSPFMVDILPGATFAPLSLAYGSGLHHGMSGVNSTFYIEALDMHSNRRNQGGDDWTVKLSSVDDFSNYQDGIIQDHGNGTYTAHIMPTRSGKNELEVKLNGSHIRGSPFEMIVIANQAVGSASFVGEGVIITALGEESISLQWSNDSFLF